MLTDACKDSAGREKDRDGVVSLTPEAGGVGNPTVRVDRRDALMAAEVYALRIGKVLDETVDLIRSGEIERGRDAWIGAERGIHCLAEIVHAVVADEGAPPRAIDIELGRLALGLHEINALRARCDMQSVATVIDRDLAPSLLRLADRLPLLSPLAESCS